MNKNLQLLIRPYILLSLTIVLINTADAQTTNSYVPNILPPSPNAAALMKFTDIPVSLYTGTTDVSVPVYTIKAKGFTLPVYLAYHTGGIRLREEASSFGLGWTLNCGGAISRTVIDKDDFNAGDYFTNTIPQLQGDISSTQFAQVGGTAPPSPYLINFWCTYKVNFSTGTADYYNAFVTNPVFYDMEPDIYSYNFAGKSGKFIITRAGKVILQKQDNIKIRFENSGNSFTITDDEGNMYYFQDKEYASTAAFNAGPISTWNISKIVTVQNDSIKFTYLAGTTIYLAADQYEVYNAYTRGNAGYFTGNNSGISYSNTTIKTIDFSEGQLQFKYAANRLDLQNAPKLDTVKLYSKSASGLTYVKEDRLYYSYFNNDPTGNSNPHEYLRLRLDSVKEASQGLSTPPYSFQYQLPLNEAYTKKHSYSVDHWGFSNGKGNTTFLPNTTTNYSPAGGTSGYFPYSFFTYSGADRSPDFTYMPAFTLNQVNYPTGGKSVFEYQENNYDQQKSVAGPQDFPYSQLVTVDTIIQISTWGSTSGTVNLSNIIPVNSIGSQVQNATLIVAFRAANSSALPALHNTFGKISFTFNHSTNDIGNSSNNCNGPVCGITVPVYLVGSNNIIPWSAYIDPGISNTNFIGINVTIQWQKIQSIANQITNNDYRVPSGGLRIKSITDYANSSTIAKKRTYQYEYTVNNNGASALYTYGKQMSLPSYVRYNPILLSNGAFDQALTLFGNSNSSLTSVVQGNIVGYDQVTEKVVNPLDNTDDGETISTFYNIADSSFNYAGYRLPGVSNMGNNLNGSLLSQIHFRNLNGIYYPVSSEYNTYSTTNRIVYFNPKYVTTGATANTYPPNSCSFTQVVQSNVYVCLYPGIKSERVLLNSSTNYVYDQSGNYVRTTKNYFYDNPVHYQVTRVKQTDSRNNSHVSFIKYPQDYIPNGNTVTGNAILDTLVSKNVVGTIIEKTDSLYQSGATSGTVTESSLSTWKQLPVTHSMALDKQYQLNTAIPLTDFQPFHVNNNVTTQDSRYRQMVSIDSYDNTNNISQYTTTDQLPNGILWDYQNTQPIAKATNASVTQIAYTSFEADGKGNWSFAGTAIADPTSPTGKNSYLLQNGNITKSGLTGIGIYIISYWSKTGAVITVSGGTATLKQGKVINGWTYKEYTVTGATTITVSGSGYIDELRLYPSNAQMVTYTYMPLSGMTSACDIENKITYYFYDGLGRLKWIKDQDGNIIKTIQYHYKGVPGIQY